MVAQNFEIFRKAELGRQQTTYNTVISQIPEDHPNPVPEPIYDVESMDDFLADDYNGRGAMAVRINGSKKCLYRKLRAADRPQEAPFDG